MEVQDEGGLEELIDEDVILSKAPLWLMARPPPQLPCSPGSHQLQLPESV